MKNSKFDLLTGDVSKPKWIKRYRELEARQRFRSLPIGCRILAKSQCGLVVQDTVSKPQVKHESSNTSLGPVPKLDHLPHELLLQIEKSLDDMSRLSLAYTCSRLFHCITLNRSQKSFTRCQKWLLMCWIENNRKDCGYPTDYACCFCKIKHPRDNFVASEFAQITWFR